jgi:hypothetical protein
MPQVSLKRSSSPSARRSSVALAIAAFVAAPLAASIVVSIPSVALAAPGDKPAPADVQKATALFIKGTELFKAKKFGAAIEHFKQSYALVPSPNSHLYIARCLAGLDQARAAWLEFDRVADEASTAGAKYAPTHDSAIQERDDLGAKLTIVSVTVPGADGNTAVRIGGYDLPSDHIGRPYPVDAGTFDVIVLGPLRAPARSTITVHVGERRDVTLPLGPPAAVAVGPAGPQAGAPPESHGKVFTPLRIGAIAAGGVGVVGLILFAAEGAASKSTYNTINTDCGARAGCAGESSSVRSNVTSLISTGKSQQTIANVGLGIGLVGVAAGATLLVLSLRKPPSDAAPRPTADLVVGPSWAGARGSF